MNAGVDGLSRRKICGGVGPRNGGGFAWRLDVEWTSILVRGPGGTGRDVANPAIAYRQISNFAWPAMGRDCTVPGQLAFAFCLQGKVRER